MGHAISITVNGTPWRVDVEPGDVLLEVLRERIGVKSPKIGCERGDCGSCTVLLDGRTVRSCLVLAVEAGGHEITTLEGIEDEGLTGIQQAMVELSAFQCGFCAPGIILATHELVQTHSPPTRREIQEAIAGNLCRCTGYEPIINAVLAATRSGSRGEEMPT